MGELINLENYRYPWREVFSCDGPASCVQVYVNDLTGEAEVVQSNDDGEVIRTPLQPLDVTMMVAVLSKVGVHRA